MSKTKQGDFDTKYHHIDAPTIQDDEYGKKNKKRKLVIPPILDILSGSEGDYYRDPTVGFLANSLWEIRRKIDGENIRIRWDGEQALWNGKTNAFVCSGSFQDYMNSTFLEEIFEEKFGRDKEVIIFGEKMGPKTQGNELGLEKDEVIIFDVCIDGYWLNKWSVRSIADYFNIRTVYDFMPPNTQQEWRLPTIIGAVAHGQFKEWEGIVATPKVEIRDQKGKRIIVKIKNRDYFREELDGTSIFGLVENGDDDIA